MGIFERFHHQAGPAAEATVAPGTPVLLEGPAVVVDVETTGIVTANVRVYEIGIVTLDSSGAANDRFETLVRPDGQLSSRLETPLKDAPTFGDVAGEVVGRLSQGVVVGHGAWFDLTMIAGELARIGQGVPNVPYLCTSDLALALHVDSPNRRLGMLCHVLGVDMASWHTAGGDAETTGRLLQALLAIADERGVGRQLRKPSTFPGTAAAWPALRRGGRVLVRDPSLFPPVGDQPDGVDPLVVERGTVSVTIDFDALLTPEMRERIAAGTARLEELNGGPFERDEWDEASDEWEDGNFRGEAGLARLRHILEVFVANADDQAPDVALKVAQFLRFDPKHSHEETVGAYTRALAVAAESNADDEEQRRWALRDVVEDWSGYLAGRQDIDGMVDLLEAVRSDLDLVGCLGVRGLVHRMRTAGQLDPAIAAAARLGPAMAAAGVPSEAADVSAEWAQALAESGRPGEAVAVCEEARVAGWNSRDLANRHSLLLERAKDWSAAVEACERGLTVAPDDEQLTKRRQRCLAHLS